MTMKKSNLQFEVEPGERMETVYEIPLEEMTIVSKLGIGSFGEVYCAEWRGALVAVKRLVIKYRIRLSLFPCSFLEYSNVSLSFVIFFFRWNLRPQKIYDMVTSFRREIVVQSTLVHPNIVIFIGAA